MGLRELMLSLGNLDAKNLHDMKCKTVAFGLYRKSVYNPPFLHKNVKFWLSLGRSFEIQTPEIARSGQAKNILLRCVDRCVGV